MRPTLRLRSPGYAVTRKGRASACLLNRLVCGSCGGGCFSSRASLEAVESPDVRLGDGIDHKKSRKAPEGSSKCEVRSAKCELRTTTRDTKEISGSEVHPVLDGKVMEGQSELLPS